LAEDNEANQFVAQELLTRLGIELEIAENGRDTIEKLKDRRFAAVLMDMQMPEMDGLEATRRIRQQPAFRDLPIIAMTANAMKSDVEACLEAGMNDFISKPIDRAALVKSLRRWLPQPGGQQSATKNTDGRGPAEIPAVSDSPSPTLEGMDIEKTVRRLGMPFETLRPLLFRFADGQRQTVAELRSAVSAGDHEAARKHAHALAGAAGNLGAEELFQAARALELAAKDNVQNWQERFADLETRANIVFRSIAGLRVQSGSPAIPAKTDAPPTAAVEPARLRDLLEQLRNALTNLDLSGCAQTLRELTPLTMSDDFRQSIDRLRKLIDDYEYDKAAEIVNELLSGSESRL
jgi:CheY-like chemotaxis protein